MVNILICYKDKYCRVKLFWQSYGSIKNCISVDMILCNDWRPYWLSTFFQWLNHFFAPAMDSAPRNHNFDTKFIKTTRTPAFWDTPHHPMITHTSDSHQIPRQSYKFKRIAKKSIFVRNLKRDTPSEVAWLDVWICKGSNHNCRHYRADTGCGTNGHTDRQTEWNQYTPKQLRCARGIIRWLIAELWLFAFRQCEWWPSLIYAN